MLSFQMCSHLLLLSLIVACEKKITVPVIIAYIIHVTD